VIHVLGGGAALGSAVTDRLKITLADSKAACDARYSEAVARGAIEQIDTRPGSALEDFWSRIRVSHARAEALS